MNLVQKALDQINAKAQGAAEVEATSLVHKILESQNQISCLQKQIEENKAKLKALELPRPVHLEV